VPSNIVVICRDGSPVAIRSQILPGIEAEACCDAHRAAPTTVLPGRTMGLCRVFHNLDAMLCGDLQDWIDVHRLAVKMHGDHGARALGDGALDSVSVYQVGIRRTVDHDGVAPT